MVDSQTPDPNAGTPPPANAELVDLKKQHNDLIYKMRMTEKELLEEKTKATNAFAELETSKKAGTELLRTKLAYEAGIPSGLLKLVTGNTEAEVKDQIKTIMDSLVSTQTPAPATTPAEGTVPQAGASTPAQPVIPNPPAPSGTPGESWGDKYMRATPEEKQKLMEAAKEQGPAFKLN
jgi:hypothetical protein